MLDGCACGCKNSSNEDSDTLEHKTPFGGGKKIVLTRRASCSFFSWRYLARPFSLRRVLCLKTSPRKAPNPYSIHYLFDTVDGLTNFVAASCVFAPSGDICSIFAQVKFGLISK